MIKQILQKAWIVTRWIGKSITSALTSGSVWKEIHVSPNRRPEPTLRRHSYLRDNGIRCKLHNLTSPSGRGIVAGMISLRVHRDDIGKAHALLRDIKD